MATIFGITFRTLRNGARLATYYVATPDSYAASKGASFVPRGLSDMEAAKWIYNSLGHAFPYTEKGLEEDAAVYGEMWNALRRGEQSIRVTYTVVEDARTGRVVREFGKTRLDALHTLQCMGILRRKESFYAEAPEKSDAWGEDTVEVFQETYTYTFEIFA